MEPTTAAVLTIVHLSAGLALYGTLRLSTKPRLKDSSHHIGMLAGFALMSYATVLAGYGLHAVLVGCCVTATAWVLGGTAFRITLNLGSRSWTLKHGDPAR